MISQHHHHHHRWRHHCTIIIAMIVATTITMPITIPPSLNSQSKGSKPRCIYELLWSHAYLVGLVLTVVLFVCHPVVVNVIVTFIPKAVLIARVLFDIVDFVNIPRFIFLFALYIICT